MPKAKRFRARIPRNQPYSTNEETARIREIEQSRTGFNAEKAKIKNKFRTQLCRRKAKLRKTSGWNQLSEAEQIEQVEQEQAKLKEEEKEELRVAWQEWTKLTGLDEQSMDEQRASNHKDSGDEGDNDPEFEDGDIDAAEDEDIFDGNGNKITMDELSSGMREILERHFKRLRQITVKWEAIGVEKEREQAEDDEWESEGGWEAEGEREPVEDDEWESEDGWETDVANKEE
jgi:hypothetical protein